MTPSTDFLLDRVARARAAGDFDAARPEWEQCVQRATDRVRTVVRAFRTGNGDPIPASERELVVNAALERAFFKMGGTLERFNETSFMAAMAKCAEFECHDQIRRMGRHAKRAAHSLDDPDRAEPVAEAERRAADDEAAFEAAHRIATAMERMSNAKRRRAVELHTDGHEYEEIAAALGVTVANAYQLVSRGKRDLRNLMEP